MNYQLIVLAFKDFWLILKNKMAAIAGSLITTVFKPFQEKLPIIRGCFTNCMCSISACVCAIMAVFLFHPLIFHNMNSFYIPLSVDTLMHLVTNAAEVQFVIVSYRCFLRMLKIWLIWPINFKNSLCVSTQVANAISEQEAVCMMENIEIIQ